MKKKKLLFLINGKKITFFSFCKNDIKLYNKDRRHTILCVCVKIFCTKKSISDNNMQKLRSQFSQTMIECVSCTINIDDRSHPPTHSFTHARVSRFSYPCIHAYTHASMHFGAHNCFGTFN